MKTSEPEDKQLCKLSATYKEIRKKGEKKMEQVFYLYKCVKLD